ncbi:MAG: hypothetical protein NT075_21800 [Chloroflexi bacterium]|nr:hypothetical protein [Chloroflexota bacterium]
MDAFDNEVSTISEGSYVGAYERLQSINAEYYNITDIESWPIAGLLVLLDGKRQPVRAELHLYEDLEDQVRDAAIRQGRLLLESRYFSLDPVPLRIMQNYQWRDTLQVQPTGAITVASTFDWFQYWPIAATVVGLLLVIGLIWSVRSLRGTTSRAAAPTATSALISQNAVTATTNITAAVAPTITIQEFPAYPVTNNLPASTHANQNLAIGQRVRVPNQPPGMTLTLRSAPGATAGVRLGFLTDSEEATIMNGPVWTEGESDTIVWWLLNVDAGVQAWAPANTSELTLLEPVAQ